jgi:origin recognition complex subunit 1
MKTKSVFSDDSLTFICKKVAVISSDIRKTLSICKEAVNLAREDYLTSKKKTLLKEVTIEMVKIAYSKIYS